MSSGATDDSLLEVVIEPSHDAPFPLETFPFEALFFENNPRIILSLQLSAMVHYDVKSPFFVLQEKKARPQ